MEIKNNSISLIRGDSASITVKIETENGTSVPLVTGDTIYFTVKTSVNETEKIFQKMITTFTDGKAIINILPSDTKQLGFNSYIYDIQLTRYDGTVTTLIKPSNFKIEGEVTYE